MNGAIEGDNVSHLPPTDAITLPSSACASTFDVPSTYLRRTIDWGILYWREAPCDLLPAGDFKILSVDTKDLRVLEVF